MSRTRTTNEKLYTIPVLGDVPDVHTGVAMLIFVMMALGLNVVVGYAGLLDLGYVAFYAIGAYSAAWFASLQFAGQNPDGSAKHSSISAPSTSTLTRRDPHHPVAPPARRRHSTALIGMLIGLPTLRLRGDYLAIVTLGFGEILPQVARNGDSLFGQNVTNGPQGIVPLDPLGFGHTLPRAVGLPANFRSRPTATTSYFWTAIVLVLITSSAACDCAAPGWAGPGSRSARTRRRRRPWASR